MAIEPTRYTSYEDAEKVVARLNAKEPDGYIVGTGSEADNKPVWYVKLNPPTCPVRGVDLSTIPVEPWRLQTTNDQNRLKECIRISVWSGGVLFVSLILGHVFGSCISYGLFYPSAIIAGIVFGWHAISYAVTAKRGYQIHQHFKCECGKAISTDVDWICGQCNHKNGKTRGAFDSFVDKCKHCENSPVAFICYHCGRVIPLIPGGDFRHPAYAADGQSLSEPRTTDSLNKRKFEAERQKNAFEEEIKALQAEKEAVMTAKELEDAKNELERTATGEFEKQMMAMEEFALGDDAIFQAGAAEEAKIRANPALDENAKKRRIDRVKLFAMAKLSERKPR